MKRNEAQGPPLAAPPPPPLRYSFASIGPCASTGKPITIAYELIDPPLECRSSRDMREGATPPFSSFLSRSASNGNTTGTATGTGGGAGGSFCFSSDTVASPSTCSSSSWRVTAAARTTAPTLTPSKSGASSTTSYPLILLISGLGAPGGIWSEAFCRLLAARGPYRVLRYDQRDTGRSTHMSFTTTTVTPPPPRNCTIASSTSLSPGSTGTGKQSIFDSQVAFSPSPSLPVLRPAAASIGNEIKNDENRPSQKDSMVENEDSESEDEEDNILDSLLDGNSSHPGGSAAPKEATKRRSNANGATPPPPTCSVTRDRAGLPVANSSLPLRSLSLLHPLKNAFHRSPDMKGDTGTAERNRRSSGHLMGMLSMLVPMRTDGESEDRHLLAEARSGIAPAHEYSAVDLAEDAIKLLDILHVSVFHLVGHSSGGSVAQLLALRYPHRVGSLTLMGSHDDGPDVKRPSPLTLMRLYRCIPTSFPSWFPPPRPSCVPSQPLRSVATSPEGNRTEKVVGRETERIRHASYSTLLPSPSVQEASENSCLGDEKIEYTAEEEGVLRQHARFVAQIYSVIKDKKNSPDYDQESTLSGNGEEDREKEEEEEVNKLGIKDDEMRECFRVVLNILRRSGPLDYDGVCRQALALLSTPSRREWLRRTFTSDPSKTLRMEALPSWSKRSSPDEDHLPPRPTPRPHDDAKRASTTSRKFSSSLPLSLAPPLPRPPLFFVPTCIINGTNDPLSPVENAKSLASTISGSRLVLMPGLSLFISPRCAKVQDGIIEEIDRNVLCYKKYNMPTGDRNWRNSHL